MCFLLAGRPAGINYVCKSSALWGRGEEADDMRNFALIALASCGVLGVALPCAAQSGTEAAGPRTVTWAKQASPRLVSPQLLAPPQAQAPAAPDAAQVQ